MIGSQPGTAEKPDEEHPGLEPFVISLSKLGSTCPSVDMPQVTGTRRRLTLIKHRVDEADGALTHRRALFVDQRDYRRPQRSCKTRAEPVVVGAIRVSTEEGTICATMRVNKMFTSRAEMCITYLTSGKPRPARL